MNINDDYLNGDFWSLPYNSKGHKRPVPNVREYPKRPTPAIRFCECGKQLTRYNKKSKCYSCQDKK